MISYRKEWESMGGSEGKYQGTFCEELYLSMKTGAGEEY